MKNIFKILLIFAITMQFAYAKFSQLDAKQTEALIKQGVPIIDIRTPSEWRKTGVIKGAKLLMFFDRQGKYDLNKWMRGFKQIVKNKNQPFILYCAHANRSNAVGKFLDEKLGYKNVNELSGGIIYGWIDKGRKTAKVK
jgi:rhodanese-related sulfurtransferase